VIVGEDSPRSICEVWEGEIFTAAALVMIAPFHRKSRRWRDGGWLAGELMPGIDAGRIAAGMAHGLARAGGFAETGFRGEIGAEIWRVLRHGRGYTGKCARWVEAF